MSMQSYPFVETAFIIDPETAAYVILAYDQQFGEVPDEIRQILDDGTLPQRQERLAAVWV